MLMWMMKRALTIKCRVLTKYYAMASEDKFNNLLRWIEEFEWTQVEVDKRRSDESLSQDGGSIMDTQIQKNAKDLQISVEKKQTKGDAHHVFDEML
uniref:Uncharacterized protein n=1 Tax=Oryza nivara TaxID=4536 RepID=A0A0E0FL12_ORYNI